MSPTAPERDALVLVRNRRYVVRDMVISDLGAEMRDKFGLDFRIVDADLLRSLRRSRGLQANPGNHFPRLITSIDFLKRPQPFRRMRDLLPAPSQVAFPRKFDLLVVDEAHNVVDSGGGTSLRATTIATLAPHFEHRIFLTATPHDGYSESFQALLALVDDQRFHRDLPPDHGQLHRVMIRRLKTDIVNDLGEPRFPKRRLVPLRVEWPDAERAAHRALHEYTERQIKSGDDEERRVSRSGSSRRPRPSARPSRVTCRPSHGRRPLPMRRPVRRSRGQS